MNKSRVVLIAIVAVAGAFLAGLWLGGSGQSTAARDRDQAQLRLNLERARVSMLHGRLELISSNFGGASKQFDAARAPLEAARNDLNKAGRDAEATRVDAALAALVQAQQMALALDRNADAKVTEALGGLQGIE